MCDDNQYYKGKLNTVGLSHYEKQNYHVGQTQQIYLCVLNTYFILIIVLYVHYYTIVSPSDSCTACPPTSSLITSSILIFLPIYLLFHYA